jgi:hypothetical protein
MGKFTKRTIEQDIEKYLKKHGKASPNAHVRITRYRVTDRTHYDRIIKGSFSLFNPKINNGEFEALISYGVTDKDDYNLVVRLFTVKGKPKDMWVYGG